MARPCSICTSPDRETIDRAIVAGEASDTAIGAEFRVSPDAISRHRAKHLPSELAKAQEAKELVRADDLLEKVRTLQAKAEALLDQAQATGDLKASAGLLREIRAGLELQAKMLGRLMPDQVHLHKHEHQQGDTDRELAAFLLRELCQECREKLARHYAAVSGPTIEGRAHVS